MAHSIENYYYFPEAKIENAKFIKGYGNLLKEQPSEGDFMIAISPTGISSPAWFSYSRENSTNLSWRFTVHVPTELIRAYELLLQD